MNLAACRPVAWLMLIVGTGVLSGCGGTRPTGELPPPVVSIAQIVEGKTSDYEEFTGRTEAVKAVDVKARVTGYLDKVLFNDGDMVKKDQELYKIDARPYQAEVNRIKGIIDRTQASIERYTADLGRARRMLPNDAISRQEYDKIVAEKNEASATLVQNKAELEKAQLTLDFCKVISPIAGRISRTRITEGNLVAADQTTLTTVVTVDPIYGYFDVDERTVLRIQEMIREEVSEEGIDLAGKYLRKHKVPDAVADQALSLIRDRLTAANRRKVEELLEGKLDAKGVQGLFAVLDKHPKFRSYRDTEVPVYLATQIEKGYPHKGHVDFVDNQLNASTGTLRVRGWFANPDGVLSPNLFIRVRLPMGDPYKAILVNESALVSDQDRKFLFVVNDQNVVEYRGVTLGPLRDGMRVVESGVKPGEWVVVSGLQRVQPGIKVDPKKVPMPTPAGQDRAPPPPPVIKKS